MVAPSGIVKKISKNRIAVRPALLGGESDFTRDATLLRPTATAMLRYRIAKQLNHRYTPSRRLILNNIPRVISKDDISFIYFLPRLSP